MSAIGAGPNPYGASPHKVGVRQLDPEDQDRSFWLENPWFSTTSPFDLRCARGTTPS